jgi:ribosome assembly protein YihI (activator of Der GTPase)
MKITEKEFNVTTGEETITERDETAAETKFRLDAEKALQAEIQAAQQRATDRAALLAQLGITEEQAKLLF